MNNIAHFTHQTMRYYFPKYNVLFFMFMLMAHVSCSPEQHEDILNKWNWEKKKDPTPSPDSEKPRFKKTQHQVLTAKSRASSGLMQRPTSPVMPTARRTSRPIWKRLKQPDLPILWWMCAHRWAMCSTKPMPWIR